LHDSYSDNDNDSDSDNDKNANANDNDNIILAYHAQSDRPTPVRLPIAHTNTQHKAAHAS
jgi:hypothetical protein